MARLRHIGPLRARALPVLALACFARANAADTTINACALLQPAEIGRALGREVETGRRLDSGLESNGAYSSSCLWLLAPSAGGRSFVILNAMQWPAGAGQAHTFLDSFHQARDAGVLEAPLSPRRLGDEALQWGDGLAVRRRDIAFGISVHVAGEARQPGSTEEQLAVQVLRRIDVRDAQLGRIVKP